MKKIIKQMKNNCSKHIVPEYLSDLKQIAEDIGNMPYDKVVEFFDHFEKKLKKDAKSDFKDGRLKLYTLLSVCIVRTKNIKQSFENVWDLCKRYM